MLAEVFLQLGHLILFRKIERQTERTGDFKASKTMC